MTPEKKWDSLLSLLVGVIIGTGMAFTLKVGVEHQRNAALCQRALATATVRDSLQLSQEPYLCTFEEAPDAR